MPATNVHPQHSPRAQADRPSPREPRRLWARLLPRASSFRHPRARFLAEWSAAILFHETWQDWLAAHPNDGVGPAELQR